MIKATLAVMALLAVSCSACASAADVPARECKELSRTIFKQRPADMLQQFESNPPERQFEIYICGSQYMHPPVMQLTNAMAAKGPAMAALLHEKLKASESNLTTRDVLRVYLEMRRTGTFDARKDPDLMNLLHSKISQFKEPAWKSVAEKMMAEIESQ